MRSRLILVILGLGGALSAIRSTAQTLNNGSFEQGGGSFTGWAKIGNAQIANITATQPSDGSYDAFLSNSSGNSVSASALSAFFNNVALPSNARGAATNGSGISQTFTAATAVTLSFDILSMTAEGLGTEWDTAFFYVDGNLTVLHNPDELNAATPSTNPSITVGTEVYSYYYPYQTMSVLLSAGTHTIGFGVYNTGDESVNSGLFIDKVTVVPEPTPMALIAVGLVSMAFRDWRRRADSRTA